MIKLISLVLSISAFAVNADLPQSNSTITASKNVTQYWVMDTTQVYRATIHINRVTLFQFPARVKFVAVGNTSEFSTTVDGGSVYVKPLLGTTHSNMIVTLHSGHTLVIELFTDNNHGKSAERICFFYPDYDPRVELVREVEARLERQKEAEVLKITEEMKKSGPENAVKEIQVHRIDGSRDNTSLKYLGYLISLDAMVSTNLYTYFVFTTNAQENTACRVSSVDKIEYKSGTRDKGALDLTEVMNAGNRLIVRSPILGEAPEKARLFITFKVYEKKKTLKVDVF